MGMERSVSGDGVPWPTIRERLSAAGRTVQMRMIDGMPAFPEEEPEQGWGELRVTLGHGMLTIIREPGRMRVVVWGNADAALLADRDALADALSPPA